MSNFAKFRNTVSGAKPSAKAFFPAYDPFKGEPWAEIPDNGPAEVDHAVDSALTAFNRGEWPALNASERGRLLNRLADIIENNTDYLARLETRDNGKLLTEMLAQIRYIPQWYRYFGGLADKIGGDVLPIDKPGMFAFTRREPLGVIAAILPWNSPLFLATWKLAPLLAAGNTVVVKPSEHASASMLAFAELFAQAGFPPGVINTVTGSPADAGEPLVTHPGVAKVAFTGGEAGGRAIYRSVAERIKPVTLELGGKSANIVFADANLDSAANGVIAGVFAASGQTCIAGSRLLVQRTIHDEFVDKIVQIAQTLNMGDPFEASTQIGPITTLNQRSRVLEHLKIAKEEGAETILGGSIPNMRGWFVEPTILTGVINSMRIAQEEIFGPVLSVIPFEDADEAFLLANDTQYGLAAGLWTSDMNTAFYGAQKLQAGTVWVNTYRVISYMTPFGGYKRSGIGRENGREAIEAYLQTKSVIMDPAARAANPFVIR